MKIINSIIPRTINMSTSTRSYDIKTFESILPRVFNIIRQNKKFQDLPVQDDIEKMITANVVGGKKTRGMTTVLAYDMFEKPENKTEESLNLAGILGWSVEIFHAHTLILDDIMDSSVTRRGVTCWYRRPDVGTRAINDAYILGSLCTEIIKTCFKDKPYYQNIIDIFDNVLLYVLMGQHLDIEMSSQRKDFSSYTMDIYNKIARNKCKTSYVLPISLGYTLTNNTDEKGYNLIQDISGDFDNFFQMQDDFLDVFGNTKLTGKICSDIKDRKCTWLAVTALQHCNYEQLKIFETYYGSKDPDHQKQIVQLFEDLGLRDIYLQQEQNQYQRILRKIEMLPPAMLPLFVKLLDNLNRRQC